MKKIIASFILCIMTVFMVSCSENNSDSLENDQTTTAHKASYESGKSFKAEDLGENYSVMPNNTENYLNDIMQTSKRIFPDADGEFRYGYKGKESINNEDCFVFSVFTENDDTNTKIGSVGISEKKKNIYIQNEVTNEYELFKPQNLKSDSNTESK